MQTWSPTFCFFKELPKSEWLIANHNAKDFCKWPKKRWNQQSNSHWTGTVVELIIDFNIQSSFINDEFESENFRYSSQMIIEMFVLQTQHDMSMKTGVG